MLKKRLSTYRQLTLRQAQESSRRLAPQPERVGLDTIGWLTGNPPASPLATLAWYLAAILRDALRSAWSSNPQVRHTKRPRERRLLRAVCPHRLHAWEVCRGSTATTVQPRSSALYPIKPLSLANDQACMRRLVWVRRLAFTRFLMSVRFSSTIVPPGSTDWTICVLSTWSQSRRKRACRRRTRARWRFALRVPFCCKARLR